MPKQYVLFGRPLPRFATPRILFLCACIGLFAIFSLLFTLPSAIPTGPNLSKFTDLKSSIPKFTGTSTWKNRFNPFKPPSHPPPRQSNDTNGDSSWYSNWKWLSTPFSSSITLEENRSLLPPLTIRPAIYCYYDITLVKDKARKDAESALLLTWRRAWWAQGFRPIILSAAEAMNNPMYEELQRLNLDPALKTDIMKWLAWENMGGGLLAHYLLFPMGAHEDPLLAYLRRGEYPALTRWKGLDDGLFAGPKPEIAAAIKQALANPKAASLKNFIAAASVEKEKDVFTLDSAKPESLAFYGESTISNDYSELGELIKADRAAGLQRLDKLVASHLQVTWQNVFSDGVAVLKPLPEHTTAMVDPGMQLAALLATCLDSPLPASCPPNRRKCSPCKPGGTSVKVTTPAKYANATSLYTIGVVPHPYTLQTLAGRRPSLDVPWVRRHSRRDAFLDTTMAGLVAADVSSGARVLRFKEAVAGEFGAAHSLWIPAERDIPEDLEWHFGFPLNGTAAASARASTTLPPSSKAGGGGGATLASAADAQEKELLERAKRLRFSQDRADVAVREAVEAWNLADTEAWRFARAYVARSRVERHKWEEEESKYAGGAGSEKKGRRESTLGRWLEKD